MKKALFLLLSLNLSLFILTGLTGCSNKDEGFPEASIPSRGDNDLKPDPSDPNDPNDPVPPPQPRETGFMTFEPEDLSKDELKDLQAPYKNFWVKRWNINKTDDNRKCSDSYKDRCIHNKQVIVQFDLDEIKNQFPPQKWTIVYAKLQASYYSLKKNHRTELLCFLNAKRCSGQVVERIPNIGLGFIARFFWWDKDFWKEGPDSVIANNYFHNLLNENYKEEDEIFILKESILDVSNVFDINLEKMQTIFRKQEKIQFAVADDTFIESPKLELKFKKKSLKQGKK